MRIILLIIILTSFVYPQTDTSKIFQLLTLSHYTYNSYGIPADSSISASHRYTALNIAGQVVLAPVMGTVCAIIPFSGAFAAAWSGKDAYPWLGISAISYMLGVSLGVKWIARIENKNLDYWKTVYYSAIGGIGGGALVFGFAHAIKGNTGGATAIAVLTSSLIGAIAYSTSEKAWQSADEIPPASGKISSQRDLIESTKLFDLQLMKINF